jgi:ribose/xylose/arabinose/galactoside ABC-type transport system permease subunit
MKIESLALKRKLDDVYSFLWSRGIERQASLLIGLIILVIFMSSYSSNFLSWRNFIHLSRNIAISGIFAVGMTLVILTGEIDLSISSTISISGLLLVGVTKDYGIFLGIVACLLSGIIIGAINGLLVIKGKIPSFAASLATMLVVSGTAMLYCHGSPINGLPDGFRKLGTSLIRGIPVPFFIFIAILIVSSFLFKLKIGSYIYAVGGNINAARLTGINVGKVKLFVFMMMGFLASFGAMILTARTNTATVYMGNGQELEAIASTVVGGTLLSGGIGNVWGTLLGVTIFTIINNGLNLLGVPSDYQYVARGLIIIGALLTQISKKNTKR